MKQIIKLTETDLRKMIKESVKKALKEADTQPFGEYDTDYVRSQPSKDEDRYYELLRKQNDGKKLTKDEQNEISWLHYKYGDKYNFNGKEYDTDNPAFDRWNPKGSGRLNTLSYGKDSYTNDNDWEGTQLDGKYAYTGGGETFPQSNYVTGFDYGQPWEKDMQKRR